MIMNNQSAFSYMFRCTEMTAGITEGNGIQNPSKAALPGAGGGGWVH